MKLVPPPHCCATKCKTPNQAPSLFWFEFYSYCGLKRMVQQYELALNVTLAVQLNGILTLVFRHTSRGSKLF